MLLFYVFLFYGSQLLSNSSDFDSVCLVGSLVISSLSVVIENMTRKFLSISVIDLLSRKVLSVTACSGDFKTG